MPRERKIPNLLVSDKTLRIYRQEAKKIRDAIKAFMPKAEGLEGVAADSTYITVLAEIADAYEINDVEIIMSHRAFLAKYSIGKPQAVAEKGGAEKLIEAVASVLSNMAAANAPGELTTDMLDVTPDDK